MKKATRLNSYLRGTGALTPQLLEGIFDDFHKAGLTHVDLNYPEHVTCATPEETARLLRKHELALNGLALRFRSDFINGELGNAEHEISQQALKLCFEAAEFCCKTNGKVLTIWLGYDGFDYSFQVNYRNVWDRLISAFQQICDYAPDLKISIEYKPFQPRAYAFIDSMGLVGMFLHEINRKNIGVTLDYCHMLMKHENPAFAADIFGSRHQLFGIHLNDGYGLNDDGLMVATVTPFKTLELLFYLKKYHYDGPIYFDTFPTIEPAKAESAANTQMLDLLEVAIDQVGLNAIQTVIDQNDAIAAQNLMIELLDSIKK